LHNTVTAQSASSQYSKVVIGSEAAAEAIKSALPHAAKMLVPGGALSILQSVGTAPNAQLESQLLLGGFLESSSVTDGAASGAAEAGMVVVTAKTPAYQSSGALLPKRKTNNNAKTDTEAKKPGVWKLMAGDVVDEELADEDALLDGDDVANGTGTAAACAPGVNKRACKDCTCGLKEKESGEPVVSDAELKQSVSGCGSCAKGDAFRCGGCPYLGLPTFTPGTKPEIAMKPDGSKVLVDMSSDI
jgi:hypothetical protein